MPEIITLFVTVDYQTEFVLKISSTMAEKATIYERLGGESNISAIVEEAYARIYADDKLNEMFKDVNMPGLKYMMKKFLKGVFGGETEGSEAKYEGRNMYEAHKYVNNGSFPTEEQLGMISTHLVATMQDLKVEGEVMEAIGALMATLAPQVLGHYNPESSG